MPGKSLIFAIFVTGLSVPATAQHMVDIPIWSNGILGQQALSNTYDNFNKANGIDPKKARSSSSRACSADALPVAERRAMEKEYARRARADGKASADAWVREQGRRFHMKLVADGVCPKPAGATKQASSDEPSAGRKKKPLLDKNGKPCTHTRLEMRTVANVGGGAMSMGPVPVCAN